MAQILPKVQYFKYFAYKQHYAKYYARYKESKKYIPLFQRTLILTMGEMVNTEVSWLKNSLKMKFLL